LAALAYLPNLLPTFSISWSLAKKLFKIKHSGTFSRFSFKSLLPVPRVEIPLGLEDHEAVVKYDPEKAKVEDLIKALKEARGMHSYDAKVKEK